MFCKNKSGKFPGRDETLFYFTDDFFYPTLIRFTCSCFRFAHSLGGIPLSQFGRQL